MGLAASNRSAVGSTALRATVLRRPPRTDRARIKIVIARGTVFAAEVDHLQMPLRPLLAREQLLQIALRLFHIFSRGQSPSPRQPMDVRVDREGRLAECLRYDDTRGLVSDSGQLLERRDIVRNASAMFVDDCLRELADVARLSRRQSAA